MYTTYLLIRNEADSKNEFLQFCSFIKGAKDRIKCLASVEKLNLFNSVTYKTRTPSEFSKIILQNYVSIDGDQLRYEFARDSSLNCSYTIITL